LCGEEAYSPEGLKLLSPRLRHLREFPFSKSAQLELALQYADKLSFSGVQRKISVLLAVSEGVFTPVVKGGAFIIKPQSPDYPELPENEDLTMKLADLVGITTPLHGLLRCSDGSLSYFIKRFDRKGKNKKISVEDFSQLANASRETKYDFSMEKLIPLIDTFCTFPSIEKVKLFLLTLFSFLIGNEDMHLKNFSLIQDNEVTQFSPAYDLVNSSIAIRTDEELALTLRGKRSKFTRADLVDYFGRERLGLKEDTIEEILNRFQGAIDQWIHLIQISFLSQERQKAYIQLLKERAGRILINRAKCEL
jgi:serine/threonine-protein kinase HipA